MKTRERFLKVLNFEKPEDRLPVIEWAGWWDKTIERWRKDGLPDDFERHEIVDYFNLDIISGWTLRPRADSNFPKASHFGAPIISDLKSYEKKIRKYISSDSIFERFKSGAYRLKEKHEKGDIIIRVLLDGYFWFPRILLGIEKHLYAFYDQKELLHRINRDLTEFNIKVVEEIFPIIKPDLVNFSEDCSYNNGPMVSYDIFKEFMTPYYQEVIKYIKKYRIKVMVDSDGDITKMIPWFLEAGIEGLFPLERMAGVDIVKIRKEYPKFLMMGGFDKLVMSKGISEMREEFERIMPVMRSGGYIPSVDHQTPPEVSLDNYKIYLKLFREYAQKAVKG